MARTPRIVRSTRYRILSVEPPAYADHDWGPSVGDDEEKVLIETGCMDTLVDHCQRQSENGLEAMGFLAGAVLSWEGKHYTVARDAVTTELEASAVHVRFDRDGFPSLFEELDKLNYNYILVGWYHSHPGYGCFLSETDMETQKGGFSEPHQFALVVDPKGKELKAFRLREDISEDVAVAVYWEDEWPWPLKK